MKTQLRRNGVYQTNDGNSRKSCAVFVRVRASDDDADTGKGNRRRTQKMRSREERTEDGGGPNLGGSLREENSQTKQIYARARESSMNNSFTSCHTRSDIILVCTVVWRDPRKDTLAEECNEIHLSQGWGKHPKTQSVHT